jgi:transcriptional regulator with XRE-family HTH domain
VAVPGPNTGGGSAGRPSGPDLLDFGAALQELRQAAGWRQQDLVDRFGGAIARSTLANVEAGRQPPSERFWDLLSAAVPEWVPHLERSFRRVREEVDARGRKPTQAALLSSFAAGARDDPLGGPFIVESVRYVYVFRHSRSPEEIIVTRRVRAVRAGATGYGVRLQHTRSPDFSLDQEALWGGYLADHKVVDGDGRAAHLRRFEFGRALRRGERHEFGLRSWVANDPEPSSAVAFDLTIPARTVDIDLLFAGPAVPIQAWTYVEGSDGPGEDVSPIDPDDPAWVPVAADGHVHAHWPHPQLGPVYGIAWAW